TEADYFPHNSPDARLSMALYAGAFLGMSVGFSSIFEWTLHGQRVYQPLPPERRWAARARFAAGGLVYVVAIVVALFSAVASFVLIALTAVYYIVERTPSSPAAPDGGDEGTIA